MTPLVRNEQRKLHATALNNVGVASIVTGGIAPVAAYFTGALQVEDPLRLASTCIIWSAIGLSCMILGRRALQELE